MPPTSKTIFEEGASIKSFKIVEKGIYQRDELVRILVDEPAKYEGCSGTRCLSDVESDLKAQIASNSKGVRLIAMLIEEYGLQMVQDYMMHVRLFDSLSFYLKTRAKRCLRRRFETTLNSPCETCSRVSQGSRARRTFAPLITSTTARQ